MKITNKNIIKKLWEFKSVCNYNWKLNQFVTIFTNWKILSSYNSIILIDLNWHIYLWNDWKYSSTTSKYRNKNIKDWMYTLLDI